MVSHPSKKQLLEWDDELLTSYEVGKLLRVDAKTVARWERAGLIKSLRTLGGHRRYWRSDVVRLLKSSNDPNEVKFLLWSNKHQKWWKADANGYTDDVDEAGRFTEWEAVHHVVRSAYAMDRAAATLMVVERPRS